MDNLSNMGDPSSRKPTGYLETRASIVADPSATYWLREAMATLEKRDPLDALKDAEILALLAQLRAKEILGMSM